MPKGPKLNPSQLWEKLLLSLRQGIRQGTELMKILGISQPSLSLLVKAHKEKLFISGKTKNTTYSLLREIPGVPSRINVYAIDIHGKGSKAGILNPVFPGESFHWESQKKNESKFYPGLPYFLDDLRPSGYLGALLPLLHPELEAPQDITRWNTDQCLRYLTRFGSDLIGNYILGEEAYSLFLQQQEKNTFIALNERLTHYEEFANNTLSQGVPGSSATGEQPKFLTTKEPHTKVIVKFSSRKEDSRARRQADLLWCEYLALQVLESRKFAVAKAEILVGAERTFLEAERFDRVGKLGRRALISLRSLDLEFAGKGENWIAVSETLLKLKKISVSDFSKIQCLDLFGALIANTDRHLGNLSFFIEPGGKFSLAPVYDMLPMLYNPKFEVVDREFTTPRPTPNLSTAWRMALPVAMEFWNLVCEQKSITREFRAIAKKNYKILERLKPLVAVLPE